MTLLKLLYFLYLLGGWFYLTCLEFVLISEEKNFDHLAYYINLDISILYIFDIALQRLMTKNTEDILYSFLKRFLWDTDLWVTLGNLCKNKQTNKQTKRNNNKTQTNTPPHTPTPTKHAKYRRGVHSTGNRLSKNEIWRAIDKHKLCVT